MPGRSTITAVTASPHLSSGVPITQPARRRDVGDHVFHFTREHVESAGDNHVLDPVDDVEEAVVVLPGHIPGAHPAILECLGGLLRQVPVPAAGAAAGHTDLTDLALGHRVVVGVEQCGAGEQCGPPAGRQAAWRRARPWLGR